MSRDPDPAPIAYVIGRGWAADLLTRLALPVIALPPRHLYRIVIHGHGFSLPVDAADEVVGFYATFHVAAKAMDDASRKALRRASDRWETFYPEARGQLVLAVEEAQRLEQRFARRSRSGFSFHGSVSRTEP